ncbi:FadR family transcriptional regulator [Williamsia sp. CHRR-6]|nr:FadR family transcriptional regulator [Williamsia sp. CHRR-6]
MATPLTTPSRVDDIESRLVTAIALGEYLPGSRLPAERELAAALGTGRESVRQALARLVERGLLRTQRGRGGGSFVQDTIPTASADIVARELSDRWESLRENVIAVSLLQGTVAEAAADNRTEADMAVMRAHVIAYRDAPTGIASQQADSRLHLSIMAAAHNSALRDVLLQLESRVSLAAPTHIWGDLETMSVMEPRAAREHDALVEAICAGRRADAGAIARAHALIDIEVIEDIRRRAGN